MQFFRHLKPVKAMTFDLDDTLYDNRPVIRQVETQMVQWLHATHPVSATRSFDWWRDIKHHLAKQDNWLPNDVTLWRFKQIEHGLSLLGYTSQQAKRAAEQAIVKVLSLRSDFTVPDETHRVMRELAQQLPLIAITNGNVDVEKIGLADYFTLVLKAGPDGYAKPHCQLFDKAQQHLGMPGQHILHVGDHLISDVMGAKQSGLQACWFNDQQVDIYHSRQARLLPDVEITALPQLLTLID